MTTDDAPHPLPNREQLAKHLSNETAKKLIAALESATTTSDVDVLLAAAAAARVAEFEKELADGDDAEMD